MQRLSMCNARVVPLDDFGYFHFVYPLGPRVSDEQRLAINTVTCGARVDKLEGADICIEATTLLQ